MPVPLVLEREPDKDHPRKRGNALWRARMVAHDEGTDSFDCHPRDSHIFTLTATYTIYENHS